MRREYSEFQERLLLDFDRTSFRPSSREIIDAFLEVPRHNFVHKYRRASEDKWVDFEPTTYHYSRVYLDEPLVIKGDDEWIYTSSNSQPSYILALLDLLKLQPGDHVLEIGSGSGWLSAIMGHLVGPTGKVTGVEISPDLAEESRRDLSILGINNVDIITADGKVGWHTGQPLNKAVVTAGAYTVPSGLFRQMPCGARLLMPIRMLGHGDVVMVMERTEFGFCSIKAMDGYFVPLVQGPSRLDIQDVSEDPRWLALLKSHASTSPMWWGQSHPSFDFIHKTAAFRAFMTATLPEGRAFRIALPRRGPRRSEFGFGIIDLDRQMAGLITKDGIAGYGDPEACNVLKRCFGEWVSFGMPCGSNFSLEVRATHDRPASNQKPFWTEQREDQAFFWQLD